MTNVAIIMDESMRLVEQGVLKMVNCDGVEMPEPIHTFAGWKARGYKVKKGEKSFIKFPIWKYTEKEVEKEGSEEKEVESAIFGKMSCFFTMAQVEKI